jgi:hypothetical protein
MTDEPYWKPMIIQCACSKWYIQMYVSEDDEIIYGTETFSSKMEAAQMLADRVIEMGIESHLREIS